MKTAKLIKCVGRMESVTTYEGETIETKVNRIVNNGEPITDGAPIIYTERKDGVLPEYDIRTDRWDIAIEAMDKVNMDRFAKRENKVDLKDVPEKKDGSPSENYPLEDIDEMRDLILQTKGNTTLYVNDEQPEYDLPLYMIHSVKDYQTES